VIYKKQRGRRLATTLATIALISGSLFAASTALAVHDTGRFQLDGDAASGTNTAGTPAAVDDWDKVCYEVGVKPVAEGGGGLTAAQALAQCGIGTPTTGATETAWTAEPIGNASIFTGGGSKDPENLDQWAWKDGGGLPDKDNLLHAFATRYSLTPSATCPSGTFATCELLYFGLDRFDNSGDAQNGFWFFQSKVTTAGTKLGGGTSFTGLHTLNDILVVSDFSNGGTVSTITIYTWDPACTATNNPDGDCADANLRLQETSDSANCASASLPTGDAFCGLVNPATITMPWSFVDKTPGPANQALNGEFYEAGINLSAIGLAGQCFSSVLSETRSSTSTTAVLKDFILGQLGSCRPTLTTQASATVASPVSPGTAVHDTATITITGASSPDDPTGDVTFYLCGPIATGDCGTSGGVLIGTGTLVGGTPDDGIATTDSPNVNCASNLAGCAVTTPTVNPLAPGRYCFRATWPGDSTYVLDAPLNVTNATTECFAVRDTSSITTAQNWRPQDSATVTTAGGTAVAGTVVFTLYSGAVCTGTVLGTFTDTTVPFTADNTTVYTANTTISWRAVFTPSDPNAVVGSTSHCETSSVTINNDIGS
jgi:hypothetical protein